MTDYTELKRLAEAFPSDLDWDSNTEPFFNGPSGESLGGGATGFYSVYGKPFRLEGEDYDYDGPTYVEACPADFAKFMVAARAGVLALIAENERLQHREQDLSASVKYWFNACGGKQFEAGVKHADEAASKYIDEHWRQQRDRLRAEIAGLKTGYEAYERVNAELKAEVGALRQIISDSATSCGAAVSVECTLDFMKHLPVEIFSVISKLRNALAECAVSLHGEMLQKFGGQLPDDMHPVTRREYDRDMAEVAGYRVALGQGEQS